jgi:ubiquinone/menaquinone biosynthesis C-methylase UbiE
MKNIYPSFKELLFRHCKYLRPDPQKYSTTDNLTIIPVQQEAYFLVLNKYLNKGDSVLDVGFGLGYGLTILSIYAESVTGIDVDKKCVEYCQGSLSGRNPKLKCLKEYNGYNIPFDDNHFDLVTCIDVLEHVENYERFLKELLRVSKKGVFISTPNRRPEYTNRDGSPKNYWHLREWSYGELFQILEKFGTVDWNFINGPYDGPFVISVQVQDSTLALSPFIKKL